MSDKPVLEYDAAMDRVDNDSELYFELIDMFFEDCDESLSTLKVAVEQSNFSEVEAVAHAMKSALGNLGGMASYDAAFELERAGRESDASAPLQDLYKNFCDAITAFKNAVESKRA